jgi:hypothetical protein
MLASYRLGEYGQILDAVGERARLDFSLATFLMEFEVVWVPGF